MKLKIMNLYVDDQDKALRFYTEKLGFQKKADFGSGSYRWLTVASPEEPDGPELSIRKPVRGAGITSTRGHRSVPSTTQRGRQGSPSMRPATPCDAL